MVNTGLLWLPSFQLSYVRGFPAQENKGSVTLLPGLVTNLGPATGLLPHEKRGLYILQRNLVIQLDSRQERASSFFFRCPLVGVHWPQLCDTATPC